MAMNDYQLVSVILQLYFIRIKHKCTAVLFCFCLCSQTKLLSIMPVSVLCHSKENIQANCYSVDVVNLSTFT